MEKPSYKWRLFLGLFALGCFAMVVFNSIRVAHGQHPTDHAVNEVVQFLGVIALIVYFRRRNEAPLTLEISRKPATSTNTELKEET